MYTDKKAKQARKRHNKLGSGIIFFSADEKSHLGGANVAAGKVLQEGQQMEKKIAQPNRIPITIFFF